LESLSTDEGIQIDWSDEHCENADSPRSESLQPHSNAAEERALHSLKHDLEIVSTDEGNEID
jgi:hypothetical protein